MTQKEITEGYNKLSSENKEKFLSKLEELLTEQEQQEQEAKAWNT